MYTVVIIDDEPWALQGLAEIIDWSSHVFSIIGQFTDPDEAFEFLCEKEPDVVFTDIRMPGLSGLDLIEMSHREGLNCEFVLISSYEDFDAAQKGIRLRVWGYVLKPYNVEEIHNTIKMLLHHLGERNNLVSVEWDDSPEEILRKAKPLQNEMENSQTKSVVLCSCLCEEPETTKEEKWIPFFVKGVGGAYLRISAEARMAWFNAPQEDNRKWGISREHKGAGLTDLPQMLQEAWYSLWGDFSYSSKQNVGEIQFYLCENMREELSLGSVAEKFHFSEPYFCALFKKGTGMSVIHFVQHMRIHYGAYLIRSSEKKFQEVAEEVGFGNYSYFGKLFKRYIGQTPEAYREGSEGSLGI